jgi:hypothetical protein
MRNAIRERLAAFPVSTFPTPLASRSPLIGPPPGPPFEYCYRLAGSPCSSTRATASKVARGIRSDLQGLTGLWPFVARALYRHCQAIGPRGVAPLDKIITLSG